MCYQNLDMHKLERVVLKKNPILNIITYLTKLEYDVSNYGLNTSNKATNKNPYSIRWDKTPDQ